MDNSENFVAAVAQLAGYINDYFDYIRSRRILPSVAPGFLRHLIPEKAPQNPDKWEDVFQDIERIIMPGVCHWQHPNFGVYFPARTSYAAILAEMLSDTLVNVVISWKSSPAATELEVIVLDWLAKAIKLPEIFLSTSEGSGGGVIQSSTTENILISLFTARTIAIQKIEKGHAGMKDGVAVSKLIAYKSPDSHSSVEKAFHIALVKYRDIELDEKRVMRGEQMRKAFEEDTAKGLTPFFHCLTTDAGVLMSPLLNGSAKVTDRISTRLTKNKSRGRFARLKAVLQHGHSQMTETRKRESNHLLVFGCIFERIIHILFQSVAELICATLGTVSVCAFDNIDELGEVCREHRIWLHVDASFAGNALICPEYNYLMNGVEYADSFSMNPHKWLHIPTSCSIIWCFTWKFISFKNGFASVKVLPNECIGADKFNLVLFYLRHGFVNYVAFPDYRNEVTGRIIFCCDPSYGEQFQFDSLADSRHLCCALYHITSKSVFKHSSTLIRAFDLSPLYLQCTENLDMPNYTSWQIPCGRSFRSLKLWFVLRLFGMHKLQEIIRKDIKLAHIFKNLIEKDERFELIGDNLMTVICFRLKGSNECNKKLLKLIECSGELYMLSFKIDDILFLRFVINTSHTKPEDIQHCCNLICKLANAVLLTPNVHD
uniref:Aromatic-L-amino-acid decarboxylase n=1 Tax=Octopus bimaculoides TaxID=37653 RepID=A0A0L8H4P3_OCTBM